MSIKTSFHCVELARHENLAGEDLACKITEIMQNSMSLHQDQTLVTLKDLHSLCHHVSYGDRKVWLRASLRTFQFPDFQQTLGATRIWSSLFSEQFLWLGNR